MKQPEPTFQQFWNTYQLKRDRIAAERAWNRLSVRDRLDALQGIASYRADCEARGIRRMYAQGYITHRRWEDEPESPDRHSLPSQSTFSPVANQDILTAMKEW